MHISADFITKLPLAQGYDSILVVVDRLMKIVHFIPTTEKTSAEGLARLFRDNVWKLHGLPESIISDRGLQFAAGLMKELNGMLGIKSKLSTAFYPQTDGQTERVNQELEQIALQVALARAIYSASMVKRATVGCFREDQEIGAEPKYEM